MTDASCRSGPGTVALVAVLSFSTIMLELIISRMSVFYLNYANSFIAIPLALFGLALGSLRVHLGRSSLEELNLGRSMVWLTCLTFFSFAAVFALFSTLLPMSQPSAVNLVTTAKTAAFVALFLPPFYLIGKILTAFFAIYRQQIGKLYAGDLAGAAAGACLTPIMFHWLDLPYLIFSCLAAMSAVALLLARGRRLALAAGLGVASVAVLVALVYLEGSYDLSDTIKKKKPSLRITEIAHRWNEFSRVSLLKLTGEHAADLEYRIIHDNAESNVYVGSYRPNFKDDDWASDDKRITLPLALGRQVKDVLVMFAGTGRQMIQYHYETAGQASITGIELNPLVVAFAQDVPELAHYRLSEFYNLPNINMVVNEGRSFLDNNRTSYDVIFVASDAATAQIKTGHSRKYLDTKEAMAAYLNHLREDGLLLFHCQPAVHKIRALKELYANQGWPPVARCIALISPQMGMCDFLVVAKKPFTTEEIAKMEKLFSRQIQYLPGSKRSTDKGLDLIQDLPPAKCPLVTDDSPFIHRVDFEQYQVLPSMAQLKDVFFYRSWIKITTLLVVAIVLAVILILLYASRAAMPPPHLMLYLIVTGFCYMLCEVGLIARLELFLGSPLLSMALLLALFLLTNALGSFVHDRYGDRFASISPLLVASIIPACLMVINYMTRDLMCLALIWKIILVVLVVAPVGTCLGLFYPFVVTWLSRAGQTHAIPVTYAVSTLSSVAGSTYAMTMIINYGFNAMLYQAAAGYALLGIGMWVLSMRRSG